MRRLAVLLLATAASAGSAVPAPAALPAEDLFRQTILGEARLSRDGTHMAVVASGEDGIRGLLVYDLDKGTVDGVKGDGQFDIADFEWVGNGRVVFNVSKDRLYSYGLYSAPIGRLSSYVPINNFDLTRIVGLPEDRQGDVLVWICQAARDGGGTGTLVELDADRSRHESQRFDGSGGPVRYFAPPPAGPVVGWTPDRRGELALCATWSAGAVHQHRYLPLSNSWSEVKLPQGTTLMGIDYDPRFAWVVTSSRDGGYALRRCSLESGELGEPVVADADYDIGEGRLYFSDVDRRLAGVAYLQAGLETVWFSKRFAAAQATVNHAFPDTSNLLVSFDRAERKFLFSRRGPAHPLSYGLLDLDKRTLTTPGGDPAPWLKGAAFAPVRRMQFVARDGLALEAFLTMPLSAGPGRQVPLVVFAHGGPWVRDTDAFNPVVQFLASRGYAVLQPNYRGSSGFSHAVSRDQKFDFLKMHEDVTDATRALVKSGQVDPSRIAIMGGSFGGYLAAAGAAFEGGLYRCAISECGVFDWESHVKSKSYGARPGEYEYLQDELGKPGIDREKFDRISPLANADRIRIPMLVAHGVEDTVVDVAQSKRLVAELRRQGVPCETFYRAEEGHGFSRYEDRVAYYHAVEDFLAKYLGGARPPPGG